MRWKHEFIDGKKRNEMESNTHDIDIDIENDNDDDDDSGGSGGDDWNAFERCVPYDVDDDAMMFKDSSRVSWASCLYVGNKHS